MFREFLFDDLLEVKLKLYHFANTYKDCSVYDSNRTETALGIGRYEFMAAIGIKKRLEDTPGNLFRTLQKGDCWKFGYMEYQALGNAPLKGYFYEPMVVALVRKDANKLDFVNNGIDAAEFETICNNFEQFSFLAHAPEPAAVDFVAQTSREQYLRCVEAIRNDIIRGRYYEMNYCIEFRGMFQEKNLLPYFLKLNDSTEAPFAAYVRHPELTIMCSSPERFLMRKGHTLVSQPIKGTNQRLSGMLNEGQMQALKTSEKERAENVMIVDLVRNDLARVCRDGTVKVLELCGAYSFRTVNHLVSTVTGEMQAQAGFEDIFRSLFPMGSMTGAPKIEVMKHIDLYEHAPRGVYSGCLGYVEPGGDFDFNVVIRSLVYDGLRSELSYKVGSAITYDSVAEDEYEECLLKGKRLFDVMTS